MKTMPFYKALELLLTTSGNTRVKRKSWMTDRYLCKKRDTLLNRDYIVEPICSGKGFISFDPTADDMVADDWIKINDNNFV